jgi:hypothetical protein
MTLRIERSERQRFTVFTLSGRMEAEQVTELKKLLDRDYQNIILDLRELRLADRVRLENCPAYVREWMDREQD